MVKSITGYGDKISVQPGDTVRFMVSCTSPQPYRARLVRVVCGDRNPAGPGVKLPPDQQDSSTCSPRSGVVGQIIACTVNAARPASGAAAGTRT